MSIALIILCDGRVEYERAALRSAQRNLPFDDFDQVVRVDDADHRLGFAGAIQHAWDQIRCDWAFHFEADFIFHQHVPLRRMVGVLDRHRDVAQLVLKRQPWNQAEQAAGGIIEQHPDDYVERADGADVWTEHRRFWSTNPCVYSSRWCRLGWPQEAQSEGMFTHRLLADPLLRFAFWGAKHDPPLVEHIGHRRAGNGY